MVQIKFLFGAGTAHVKQATFFFKLVVRLLDAQHRRFADQREDSVIAAGNMDRMEFQPLRHMDGHEGHLPLGLIHLLIAVRQEGDVLKESV